MSHFNINTTKYTFKVHIFCNGFTVLTAVHAEFLGWVFASKTTAFQPTLKRLIHDNSSSAV